MILLGLELSCNLYKLGQNCLVVWIWWCVCSVHDVGGTAELGVDEICWRMIKRSKINISKAGTFYLHFIILSISSLHKFATVKTIVWLDFNSALLSDLGKIPQSAAQTSAAVSPPNLLSLVPPPYVAPGSVVFLFPKNSCAQRHVSAAIMLPVWPTGEGDLLPAEGDLLAVSTEQIEEPGDF